MRRLSAFLIFVFLTSNVIFAQGAKPVLTEPVDESNLVRLAGNTLPAPLAQIDRGAVADSMALNHLLLTLKRPAEAQFRLQRELDAMHDPASPRYHHWLTTTELGERFGLASQDTKVLRHWLESHGFIVNRIYQNGLLIDFSGNAGQVRAAFHTEIHNLVLPNGEKHIANISDPQIPAALAPGVEGVASLHDFFPKPHRIDRGSLTYSPDSQTWHPHFTLPYKGTTYHVVAPFDFATIYNLLPLWKRGITGKGVTIATVEDSNLAHPQDWAAFRESFGMDGFTGGNFKQIYPNCANPGQNGDEIEAALDVEWASASAPDANVELSACANSRTTSGLDLAIINLLETAPPDIISDSYGLCETINADANGVPVSKYWSATNNPKTLASALSYIPEIPWNDTCASELIYSDPKNGRSTQSYGATGFCNSALGQSEFLNFYGGSGGPSTCFTGKPSIPGVVSGSCKGNPKPLWQAGVPGIPNDGLSDQPDLALFAADGVWGSFYVECMSDTKTGGAPCTPQNDAILEGGGGTSFASPAMAGIQALIDQNMAGKAMRITFTMRSLRNSSSAKRRVLATPVKPPEIFRPIHVYLMTSCAEIWIFRAG